MRALSFRLSFAPLLAVLTLAGCFGGHHPPPALLTLTAAQVRAPGTPHVAAQGEVITVTTPAVPQAIRNSRVPVYVNPTTIEYVPNAQWVEPASELFRSLLAETIAARTGRVVLDPATYSQVQGLVVSGNLLMFGLDPTRNEVVVQFDATVSRAGSAVATNRFEARAPVAQVAAQPIAEALNQASNQVAGQVADWIGSQAPPTR